MKQKKYTSEIVREYFNSVSLTFLNEIMEPPELYKSKTLAKEELLSYALSQFIAKLLNSRTENALDILISLSEEIKLEEKEIIQ